MHKKSHLVFSTIFLALFMLLCPSTTKLSAESCTTDSGQSGVISTTTGKCVPVLDVDNPGTITSKSSGGLIPCGHGSDYANRCTLCDFIVGFKNLIDFASKILITVAVVGIFFSGVIYIISSGNEGLLTKAKAFLSASLVGFTVVLGAWLLVNVVMWVLSYDTNAIIQKTNWYTFDCNSVNTTTTK